ncbi:MAG: T9SS type A sorting domain-containing protein [Bacteroidales bacterium]|nr:T9SS type A sorting domain-containing protein [Bacteroidales bacterium]
MKTFLLLITGIVLSVGIMAQQVDRDRVLVEIGTGTWCQFCPGAAMGADDLVENGCSVAVIEYHNGDIYVNAASTARNSYYGITSFPTAKFDGIVTVSGGSNTQSMYNTYLPKYQQRIAIPSSFTIDMDVNTSGLDYTVDVTVTKVADYTGTNLVFQLALTESHIEQSWQGQSELNFVERLMAPSASGTALDFSSSNTVSFQLNFTIDAGWDIEFCELAGFIQDNTSKEILQGALRVLATPEFSIDAEAFEIFDLPEEMCSGWIAPSVTIRSRGAETLTSLDVVYSVNGGEAQTYPWTGELDFLEKDSFVLPEIAYDVMGTNTVTVTVTNPNGLEDENPDNNTITADVMEAETISPVSYLILRTDEKPQETTWDLKNSAGDVLYSGGPYTAPLTFIRDTFELYNTDCYVLTVYDAGGDGLCCGSGTGFVRLVSSTNATIIYGMSFADEYVGEFNVFAPVGISDLSGTMNVEIYPNPVENQANIVLNLKSAAHTTLSVYDLVGKQVLTYSAGMLPAGASTLNLDASTLNKGIFVLHITAGEATLTQKITVR